ncbi:MAG: alpha/beta fold hydrolase [Mycobacteriaceae bacterium]
MEAKTLVISGREVLLRIGGPNKGLAVLLLPGVGEGAEIFTEVCERLHTSDLRTFCVDNSVGLTTVEVIAILDELSLPWVHLVGNNEGAQLAWELAATTFGRFTSLVVVGSGHPGVPDVSGEIQIPGCPAVEVNTTMVLASEAGRRAAYDSGRHVYADFRILELNGLTSVPKEAAASLATEIVLRTSPW